MKPGKPKKLNAEKVMHIRKLAAGGIKQRAIATEIGCSQYNVSLVVRRKIWAHV